MIYDYKKCNFTETLFIFCYNTNIELKRGIFNGENWNTR